MSARKSFALMTNFQERFWIGAIPFRLRVTFIRSEPCRSDGIALRDSANWDFLSRKSSTRHQVWVARLAFVTIALSRDSMYFRKLKVKMQLNLFNFKTFNSRFP